MPSAALEVLSAPPANASGTDTAIKELDRGGDKRAEFHDGVGRVSRVERPCILRPTPPYEPKHEHGFRNGRPVQAVVNQHSHLGDSKYEYEIEEQLDEGRALVVRRNEWTNAHPMRCHHR